MSLSNKVSVIIPTYNRAKLVIWAVESVLEQTYKNYEIIVVDDGSNDNTARLLNPYMDHINYIYQKNRGISSALNKGLTEANDAEFSCTCSLSSQNSAVLSFNSSGMIIHKNFKNDTSYIINISELDKFLPENN